MNLPNPIQRLIDHFEQLPGIGPKTAQRLVFYMLRLPKESLQAFGSNLAELKNDVKLCSICRNVSEGEVCKICSSSIRNKDLIAVVSSPLDMLALERANFEGVYHVLHGVINPLAHIGPDDIYIDSLIKRLVDIDPQSFSPVEVLLATNTSMEGESTAMYISKLIRDKGFSEDVVKITRIARGLPVGGDIEYADDVTLSRALSARSSF
jgi:recombination protein RecR